MKSSMQLLLNCDLGESFGAWRMGVDEQVMPFIDQANIACGFHAGDPMVMKHTLQAAKNHNVAVGAHPSYPDLGGFGRRSMTLPAADLIAILQYQIAALVGMANNLGIQVEYVKPHGALYNDMMVNGLIRSAVMQAIAETDRPLAFMMQANGDYETNRSEAKAFGLKVMFEGFADRCYDDRGALVSRAQMGAVHNREKMLAQVTQLMEHGSVTTENGHLMPLHIDSLCVHGDNLAGVESIADIRRLIDQ
ncbi:MAG: 5-oxoprolinase subunit PxpA [Porticoccaceae bacterium]|nr:5-oxoprolinase subunit PxpA [Porticoccaceae bacterium]